MYVVSLLVYDYVGCTYRTIVCCGNVCHLISKINIHCRFVAECRTTLVASSCRSHVVVVSNLNSQIDRLHGRRSVGGQGDMLTPDVRF